MHVVFKILLALYHARHIYLWWFNIEHCKQGVTTEGFHLQKYPHYHFPANVTMLKYFKTTILPYTSMIYVYCYKLQPSIHFSMTIIASSF